MQYLSTKDSKYTTNFSVKWVREGVPSKSKVKYHILPPWWRVHAIFNLRFIQTLDMTYQGLSQYAFWHSHTTAALGVIKPIKYRCSSYWWSSPYSLFFQAYQSSSNATAVVDYGVTTVGVDFSPSNAILVEMLLTLLFVMVHLHTTMEIEQRAIAPVATGFALTACIISRCWHAINSQPCNK